MNALESLVRLTELWIIRAPVTQCMLLAKNPSASALATGIALFIGIAWLDLRGTDSRTRERVVFAFGLMLAPIGFLWFFRGGAFAWDVSVDGQKDWIYYAALREAALRNELPYYLLFGHHGTERYLANPETPLVPYALVMRMIGIPAFFMTHLTMVVAAGYCGLAALKRELNLSLFSWSTLFVLFLFNGHITAHLSLGRMEWLAYFLLPWAFLCFVRLSRGDTSFGNAVTLACTLAAMMILGGWHIFVWSLIFFLVLCATSVPRVAFAVKTMLLAALLAAVRLLPALVTFGAGTNVFRGGFRHATVLLQALIGPLAVWVDDLDGFEYDTYVGYMGLALVCIGLIPQRLRATRYLNALLLAAAVLLVLSCGDVYKWTLFRLPGFVSQRFVTRFLVVPVLTFAMCGLVRLDPWVRDHSRRRVAVGLLLLVASWFLVVQLVLNASYARPSQTGLGLPLPVNVIKHIPVEAAYLRAVWTGITLSTATLLWIAWQAALRLRERSRPSVVASAE
jgi:hypothetical protein